ncbi:MAG TPA: hypothetical protein VHU84_17480, partial [Lacipirellulaceae bacterium]|nr:hypothetical protein [Lacipirellulaceae bacterium]
MLLKSGRMLFVSLSILTIVLPRFSAAKNWNSTSGNWSESAKWTPSGVPGNGDAVNIVFTNGVARTVTYDYSGGLAVTIDSLSVDLTGAGGNATTLSIPGNTLHANQERIGIDGIGTINQTGGTNLIETNGLALGFNNAGIGNYSLDVGTLSVAGDENIGFSGQGVFTQTSGSNTSANLYLGTNTTGMGTYTLSGGTLQPNNEVVGALGTGNITQAGGTFIQNGGTNNTGFLSIGGNIGATGSYTLNAGSLIAGTLNVGSQGGTGSFTQAGGSQTSAELNVGSDLGSNGTYALSGG